MNLHEYQGKQLFAEYGLPVSKGYAVDTPVEAAEAEGAGAEPEATTEPEAVAESETAPNAGAAAPAEASSVEVRVPDIGDFEDVPVIEVLVAAGDAVEAEQSLVTLESDKATMEVPAPQAGVVDSPAVAVDDTVSEGDLVLMAAFGAGLTWASVAVRW